MVVGTRGILIIARYFMQAREATLIMTSTLRPKTIKAARLVVVNQLVTSRIVASSTVARGS